MRSVSRKLYEKIYSHFLNGGNPTAAFSIQAVYEGAAERWANKTLENQRGLVGFTPEFMLAIAEVMNGANNN
jgi:hypothetical protein